TTVSVGPYSLTITVPGAFSSHDLTSAPASASPPTTSRHAALASSPALSSSLSKTRCPGTTLTRPNAFPSRSTAASPSTPPGWLTTTADPVTSGKNTLVTVRSKASEVCNGAPRQASMPYPPAAHTT